MMIDITKICSTTFEEVFIAKDIVNEFAKYAEEAKEMSKLIRETHKCFGIGENEIQIFSDEKNNMKHWLKQCGVWFVKNEENTQEFGLNLAPAIIYEFLKREYMLKEKYVDEKHEMYACYVKAAETIKYFRIFVEFTKECAKLKKTQQ